MSTKPSNTSSIAALSRCQHRFANGMRCSVPTPGEEVQFCSRHTRPAETQPLEQDLSAILLKQSQDFQTAQGVNFSLASLYELLAKNRISARRAAVLAYISSLILRTHPAIDADHKANIKDPTKSVQEFPPMPEPDPTKKPS